MSTSIEWTDTTWNPVRGCSMAKGSEAGGCLNCYAARQASRNLPGMRSPTTGQPFAVLRGSGPRWTGAVELIPSKLGEPLSWKGTRRCFVNSMSDLFHEALPFEAIAAVFGMMAACPHVTFQILTKRPERAREFFGWCERRGEQGRSIFPDDPQDWRIRQMVHAEARRRSVDLGADRHQNHGGPWPLPNAWLGTSCENQETADKRIPELLQCPAAVRFVSYEPALGPVDFHFAGVLKRTKPEGFDGWSPAKQEEVITQAARAQYMARAETVDWVIVGGESGPGARPFDVAWARSTVEQCKAAGVAVFVKQLGRWVSTDNRTASPYRPGWERPAEFCPMQYLYPTGARFTPPLIGELFNHGPAGWTAFSLADSKGGNLLEWPEDLRVREFPEVARG